MQVQAEWADLPTTIRARVLREMGRLTAEATSIGLARSNFSPGITCILTTPPNSYFIKAMHESHPPAAVSLMHDERDVLLRLPPLGYPVPQLRLVIEDQGWTVLITDAVEGHSPGEAIDEAGLEASLNSLIQLQQTYVPDPTLPTLLTRYENMFDNAARLLHEEPSLRGGASIADATSLMESAVIDASSGNDLVHGDLRGDNVVLHGGEAWLVDWAWGCRGQGWADAVTLICAASAIQSHTRWRLLTRHPASARATSQQLRGYALAIAGMYTWASRRPPPPGLLRLRKWQDAQARSAKELVLASYQGL